MPPNGVHLDDDDLMLDPASTLSDDNMQVDSELDVHNRQDLDADGEYESDSDPPSAQHSPPAVVPKYPSAKRSVSRHSHSPLAYPLIIYLLSRFMKMKTLYVLNYRI